MTARSLVAAFLFIVACRAREPVATAPPPVASPPVAATAALPPRAPVAPADAAAERARVASPSSSHAAAMHAEATHMADLLGNPGPGTLVRHAPTDAGASRHEDLGQQIEDLRATSVAPGTRHDEPVIGTGRGPGKH